MLSHVAPGFTLPSRELPAPEPARDGSAVVESERNHPRVLTTEARGFGRRSHQGRPWGSWVGISMPRSSRWTGPGLDTLKKQSPGGDPDPIPTFSLPLVHSPPSLLLSNPHLAGREREKQGENERGGLRIEKEGQPERAWDKKRSFDFGYVGFF